MLFQYPAALMLALAPLSSAPVSAGAPAEAVTPQTQLELIASWDGEWELEGVNGLTIRFETQASGHSVIERWETARGLHSMTIYHRAGDRLMATHYCPQGNQPRLVAKPVEGAIAFEFLDVTDLDEGEEHAHNLAFEPSADGTVLRTEIYWGKDGARNAQNYVMKRKRAP